MRGDGTDKKYAQNSPKHTISNEKFIFFSGKGPLGGPSPPRWEGYSSPHTVPRPPTKPSDPPCVHYIPARFTQACAQRPTQSVFGRPRTGVNSPITSGEGFPYQFSQTVRVFPAAKRLLMHYLWSPYVLGLTSDHYIFIMSFVLSLFFLFSSPNLSRRRLDVCHTSTHGVALVRI